MMLSAKDSEDAANISTKCHVQSLEHMLHPTQSLAQKLSVSMHFIARNDCITAIAGVWLQLSV